MCAVEFTVLANQVAAVSGDVRRVLELCRKGAEVAAEEAIATAGASATPPVPGAPAAGSARLFGSAQPVGPAWAYMHGTARPAWHRMLVALQL